MKLTDVKNGSIVLLRCGGMVVVQEVNTTSKDHFRLKAIDQPHNGYSSWFRYMESSDEIQGMYLRSTANSSNYDTPFDIMELLAF